jgi:hypothetical protein
MMFRAVSGRRHGVDIGQGVGGGDLPEGVGVVDDGGEEVDGLDDGQIVAETIDARVLVPLETDDEVGVLNDGKPLQGFAQVLRTDLARSTGRVDHLGEPDFLFLCHVALLLFLVFAICRAHSSR